MTEEEKRLFDEVHQYARRGYDERKRLMLCLLAGAETQLNEAELKAEGFERFANDLYGYQCNGSEKHLSNARDRFKRIRERWPKTQINWENIFKEHPLL
jgi:hypothetical protein